MPDLFSSARSIRAAYDAVDWSATLLGPVSTWSDTLRGAVDLVLNSDFPLSLMWGPRFVLVYNEAYADLIADKHPAALGEPAQEVFPEAWHIVGPLFEGVWRDDRPTGHVDAYVPLHRSGFLEECWFTFSYSPVHGPDGRVEGILDIAVETTSRVVLGRRLQLLTRLGDVLASAEHVDDVLAHSTQVLDGATPDVSEVRITAPPRPFPRRDVWLEETPDGRVAWLPLGAAAAEPRIAMAVRPSPHLAPDDDYLSFLGLLAATVDQALERVTTMEAERSFSEALQRSLLTRPPATAWAEVAVRYQPAAEVAQVGGDWYDGFRLPDGSLMLVVGDVAGHDENAAAVMAQLRSLLRGVSYHGGASPAAVLAGLDGAMASLEVGVVATALVARVRPHASGGLEVVWCSAGHLPPVVVGERRGELLERAPDLLLGLHPETLRTDHRTVLPPGSSLVLYTDGLVERRGVSISTSLAWLADAVADRGSASAEDLCDHLLTAIGSRSSDDVALLVVRPAASAPA